MIWQKGPSRYCGKREPSQVSWYKRATSWDEELLALRCCKLNKPHMKQRGSLSNVKCRCPLGIFKNPQMCPRKTYYLDLYPTKGISSFSSVQSLSHVRLFVTPWITARQASLSITNSWSLLKLMSIQSVMPSNHLILCCPLLLLPSIFPSIRVFSSESVLHIRWPTYWFQLQ